MDEQLSNIILTQFGTGGVIILVTLAALWKLYSEQRKLMVESAHQLNRDLISKRASAYATLWSGMRPLAIYSDSSFDSEKSKLLYEELSNWYFSEDGGLFLSERARDFYFCLQSFLQSVGSMRNWVCQNRPENSSRLFMTLLEELAENNTDITHVLEKIRADRLDTIDPEMWKSTCKQLLEYLSGLVTNGNAQSGDLIFASAQQISSILRTNLACEVHSRLKVDWPEI